MKKDYQKMEKESWVLISDLETKLENIEKQRATSISSELSDCGHLLKKLNYQRHDVIDTRLQEEVTNYNQLLLTNRETIYEQLNYLRCIFQETKVKTVSYFKKADSEWAKIRYSYIHPIIYKEIENDLSFSFEDFYSSYQTQFNNFVKQEALQIDDMLHWNPSDSITNIVTSYQDVSKTIVTLQHDKIKEFTEEVSLIEKRFADKISNAYKYWLPRVKECSEQGASTLLDEINGLRKSSEIANGKHASISLYSKAARNNHLLSKIMEFLCCISLTKEQLINGQLLEVEVDIVSQLRDLNLQYESNKSGLEKDLQMEVSSLRLETKEILIKKRLQKSKEFIKSIIESKSFYFIEFR
ncbi:hypothetical protein BC833DRAFT_168236 [Globomyces pollinis-pini]|nr:hypothetical protein BC833DRAFT_168236 [Globomyces pollinis-pini]